MDFAPGMCSACPARKVLSVSSRIFKTTWILAGLVAGALPDAAAIAVADLPTSEASPTNAGYAINWDYVFKYKNASSVAVDWYWILTAAHVADDGPSGNLIIGGETYTQQQIVYHPTADLALVRYDKPFPGYYPLHEGEIWHKSKGQTVYDPLIMVGYGYAGTVAATTFTEGGTAGIKRWGTNRGAPEAVINADIGGGNVKSTLCFKTQFLLGDTPYEAGANTLDSGGPSFIGVDSAWKLAGIALYRQPTVSPFTENYSAFVPDYVSWIKSVVVDYDTDMDGLPDWWETAFAGDALSMAAADNTDGDGFTNYEEWLADTVPTNSASFPWIGAYTNAAQLVFGSSSNRQYQIEYRLDLADTNGVWGIEVPWFPGAHPQTEKTVTTLSGNRFFRLRVRLH